MTSYAGFPGISRVQITANSMELFFFSLSTSWINVRGASNTQILMCPTSTCHWQLSPPPQQGRRTIYQDLAMYRRGVWTQTAARRVQARHCSWGKRRTGLKVWWNVSALDPPHRSEKDTVPVPGSVSFPSVGWQERTPDHWVSFSTGSRLYGSWTYSDEYHCSNHICR